MPHVNSTLLNLVKSTYRSANPRAAVKTLVVVDIQPEYAKSFPFKLYDFVKFLSRVRQPILYLYNGADTVGMVSEEDLIAWLIEEGGMTESILDKIRFYDKGYAFFRYCMDSGVATEKTIDLIRAMYLLKVFDSRELPEEFWESFSHKELEERLTPDGDMVNIPDLMLELANVADPMTLVGGGRNECLAEVEIALAALGKRYSLNQKWVY